MQGKRTANAYGDFDMDWWRGNKRSLKEVQLGRSGVIRTLDPLVPNEVRYQAALHSELKWGFYRPGFSFPQAVPAKK
jgi:hypothetical protein